MKEPKWTLSENHAEGYIQQTWFWKDQLQPLRREAGSVPSSLSPGTQATRPHSLLTPQLSYPGLACYPSEPHCPPAALPRDRLSSTYPACSSLDVHLSVCLLQELESWGSWSSVWPSPAGAGILPATCQVLSELNGKGKQPNRRADHLEIRTRAGLGTRNERWTWSPKIKEGTVPRECPGACLGCFGLQLPHPRQEGQEPGPWVGQGKSWQGSRVGRIRKAT